MKTTLKNEYYIIVDSNGVPHLEILVEHSVGEIWARIHGATRLCTEVTLCTCDTEVDLKSDVLHDWIDNPTFRTLEDLQELREAMESWLPAEPDFQEPPEPEPYGGPRNFPEY